jgi:hypothetical protein
MDLHRLRWHEGVIDGFRTYIGQRSNVQVSKQWSSRTCFARFPSVLFLHVSRRWVYIGRYVDDDFTLIFLSNLATVDQLSLVQQIQKILFA